MSYINTPFPFNTGYQTQVNHGDSSFTGTALMAF